MSDALERTTFDPNCETCGGSLHPCECHIFGGGDFERIHPPHGRSWWEWRGICPDCHEHEWKPYLSSMIQCSICRMIREVVSDGGEDRMTDDQKGEWLVRNVEAWKEARDGGEDRP